MLFVGLFWIIFLSKPNDSSRDVLTDYPAANKPNDFR